MKQRYKYVLLSNNSGERLELSNAPIGWSEQKINIIRDALYFGVLKTISVQFEFVGDGFTFIQKQKLLYGWDASVIMRVYNHKREYVIEGKINYLYSKEYRTNRRFVVDLIQSDFVQKFQSREDVKYNVLNNISADRTAITPAETQTATIRGKQIEFYSEFEDGINGLTAENLHHVVPFKLIKNGSPYVKEVNAIHFDTDVENFYTSENAYYVNELTSNQELEVDISMDYTITYSGPALPHKLGPGELPPWISEMYQIYKLVICNADNSIDSTLKTFTRKTSGSFIDAYSDTVTLTPGQYLIFVCERWAGIYSGAPELVVDPMGSGPVEDNVPMDTYQMNTVYNALSMTIVQPSVYSNTTAPVILPHELFSNLVSQIWGKDGAFYSTLFGRTDIGYDQDGEEAYLGVTTGEWLRGVPLDETQLATSFRDAFTSYNSEGNLGVLIRGNTLIIEKKDDLFSNEIVADIGEVSDLVITPASEFLFNSIKAGYPSQEYEQENGRDEFNTPVQYSNSFQGIKKELNLLSVYYADGYGIEFARRASITTTGTADSRYDGKIFLIDLLLDEGDLISRRQEGINFIDGIFSPETVINARIAPGQNLLRWRKFLNIPLHRKPDKVCYFQSKEKNASLELITDLGETYDGFDISLGSRVYFMPEEKSFKSPLTLANLFPILENPLGLVKYSHKGEKFYDYLYEVDGESEKAKGAWRMLSTRPTPIEVTENPIVGDYILYGDGSQDFLKYADGSTDLTLYN
jgi:hypothetical protein